MFISDMRNHLEQTCDLMNGFERYGYILSKHRRRTPVPCCLPVRARLEQICVSRTRGAANLVLLAALSLMWFVLITNGLLKALRAQEDGIEGVGLLRKSGEEGQGSEVRGASFGFAS